jgi:Rrf2 family transcriptional regulator, nitric oxide-sensitive transcriptional repressor
VKLTLYTSHAFSVLRHLAEVPERLSSIREITHTHSVSHSLLTKLVRDLRSAGLIETVRGRSGGIRLARPPQDITLGELVLCTERTFGCDKKRAGSLSRPENLDNLLNAAFNCFVEVLKTYSLVDIVELQTVGSEISSPPDYP